MTEGVLGGLTLAPLFVLGLTLLPPIIEVVFPTVQVGTGLLSGGDVSAPLSSGLQAIGLPAPFVSNPFLAGGSLLIIGAVLPALATNYALHGTVRATFDPRRLLDLIEPVRYGVFLLAQLGYIGVFPVAVTVLGGFGFAIISILIAGPAAALGSLLVVVLLLSHLAILMVFPVASAALWGFYARDQPIEDYDSILYLSNTVLHDMATSIQ